MTLDEIKAAVEAYKNSDGPADRLYIRHLLEQWPLLKLIAIAEAAKAFLAEYDYGGNSTKEANAAGELTDALAELEQAEPK